MIQKIFAKYHCFLPSKKKNDKRNQNIYLSILYICYVFMYPPSIYYFYTIHHDKKYYCESNSLCSATSWLNASQKSFKCTYSKKKKNIKMNKQEKQETIIIKRKSQTYSYRADINQKNKKKWKNHEKYCKNDKNSLCKTLWVTLRSNRAKIIQCLNNIIYIPVTFYCFLKCGMHTFIVHMYFSTYISSI